MELNKELLNFSYFEEEFRKYFSSDLTFSSILNLSDSFSKWKLICGTYDDFQKLRSISIFIKSWTIYLSIEKITSDNTILRFNDDELEAIQVFLLEDLEFIDFHLNELKSYFNIRSDSVENITAFQSQIKIIKKPISDEINGKLNSYLVIFLQKINLFKNVFLDFWPPLENNFRNILKANLVENPRNLNDISSPTNVKFNFCDMKEFMKNFSGTNEECLSEIHKLCRNPELQNTIKKSLQIKQWGSDGIEPDLVKEIQNSLGNYRNFHRTFIYKIHSENSLKCESSEQNLFTSEDDYCTQLSEMSSDIVKKYEIDNYKSPKSKSTKRKLYTEHSPSFIDQSISVILEDISTVRNFPVNKQPVNNSHVDCKIHSKDSESAIENLSSRFNIRCNSNSNDSGSRTYSAFSNLRSQWNMNESFLIYKGVQEGLTWSAIKFTYFRNSIRTNVHIKDRWRVILKKPELIKELQLLLESDRK